MNDIRCKNCKILLFKANWGEVEIKCQRCGTMNEVKLESQEHVDLIYNNMLKF